MWISGEKYHQQIKIKDEAIGYDYTAVFGQYITDNCLKTFSQDADI